MKTIAFYSYKGGVGRSLAVSHVAYWLSREDKTVFLLDMDMEAPGLHYKLEQYNHKITPMKGLVDFIGYFNREDKAATSLKEYVIPLESTENKMSPMWLMPSGDPFASTYWKQLSSIEWKEFLYQGEMLGSLLFLELKALIEKEYNPDFLLIDSRTGLNDLTGIGMNLLADDAVILGVNNPENIDGSRIVMEKLRRAEKLPFKEAKTRLHFVLTRIPAPETKADSDWEEKLKLDVLTRLNAGSGIASGPLVTEINVVHIDPEQAMEERNRFKEKEWNLHRIALDYSKLASIVTGVAGTANAIRFQEIDRQYSLSSDPQEREELIRQLFELETTNPFLEFRKGWLAHLVLGEWEKAKHFYSNAIALNPDFPEAHNNRGNVFVRLKENSKALEDYQRSIEIQPKQPDPYYNRAILLLTRQEYFDALVDLEKAIEIRPEFWAAIVSRGVALTELGKLDESICSFDQVIAARPDAPEAYNGKAFSLYKQGKFDDALFFAKKGVELNDQMSILYGTLAEIYSALGSTNHFYESLENALSLDPSEVDHLDPATIARHENEPRFQELLKKYKKA